MSHTPSEYELDPPAASDSPWRGADVSGVPFPEPVRSGEGPSSASSSTTDVAKDEAANLKDVAMGAGQNLAATAKDESVGVADETKQQARYLLDSASSEVQSQARSQQQKIASSIHALSHELAGMASNSPQSGPLTDLAHQAAQKGGELAHWLENREPRDVLHEVQSFARRRPLMFLALCGTAGVLAGRITRGAVAANTSVDSVSGEGHSAYQGTYPPRDAVVDRGTDPIVDPLVDVADRSGGVR